MALITIGTPFNIDLEFQIATFNKRLLGWLIDMVVICVYYYIMLNFIYPLLGMSKGISTAAELFFVIIPVLIYQLIFELMLNGQTLGKMAAGIKVIDNEGKEPTWGQYLMRWLLCLGNLFIYGLPYIIINEPWAIIAFMILYIPDFLCMIITSKSQRIGDLAAGTVVIDKNYVTNISETIYKEIEEKDYQPVFPQVMRLTDRDINGIRNLIQTKRTSKDTDAYMFQVVDKIKAVLSIETELDGYEFLQQLLFDYNYFTTRN